MSEKFEIYLGLNDKDTKKQEVTTLDAYKICVNICKECSISEMTGFYTHNNGEVVVEKSLKIEIFGKNGQEVKTLAEQLRVTFNQESVIVNKILTQTEFIGG